MLYQVCINEHGARCVKLPTKGAIIKILEVPTRGRVHIREITKARYRKFKVSDWFGLPTMYAVLCLAGREYGIYQDAREALEKMVEDLPEIKDNLPTNGSGLYLATKEEISGSRKEGEALPSWELEATTRARKAVKEGRPPPYGDMPESKKRSYEKLVALTPPWEPLPRIRKWPRPPSIKGLLPPQRK